jgi:uncharacterized protein (DUF1697 family)
MAGRQTRGLIETMSTWVFDLHAPDGVGRSKLAARVEKALGVAVTARNWRTVERLWRMTRAT